MSFTTSERDQCMIEYYRTSNEPALREYYAPGSCTMHDDLTLPSQAGPEPERPRDAVSRTELSKRPPTASTCNCFCQKAPRRRTDSHKTGKLQVDDTQYVLEIIDGSNLPVKDALSGASDPYVKATLIKKGRGGLKTNHQIGTMRQSLTKLTTVNPVWHFYVDFDVTAAQAADATHVLIDIWDEDAAFTSDDWMCRAMINLSDLSETARVFKTSTKRRSNSEAPAAVGEDHDTHMSAQSKSLPRRCCGKGCRRCWCCAGGKPTISVRRVLPSESPYHNKMTIFFIRHGESQWNRAQANLDAWTMVCYNHLSCGLVLRRVAGAGQKGRSPT
jgi:hypothetical protein